MFIRRDRRRRNRFEIWRVALLFLAAGVWLGGLLAKDDRATGLAIVILLAALLLGLVGRRGEGD